MLAGFTRRQQEKYKNDFNPLDFVWLKTTTQETSNPRVDTDNRTIEQTLIVCTARCACLNERFFCVPQIHHSYYPTPLTPGLYELMYSLNPFYKLIQHQE